MDDAERAELEQMLEFARNRLTTANVTKHSNLASGEALRSIAASLYVLAKRSM